ncbi:MAG TPA: ribonuclease P protein component [Candidatus Aquilonibacter sp.]|nr:ribonuclease P protein component [Candidatus Aquilonibacter sp.]
MRSYASLRRSWEFTRLRQRGRRIATGALTVYRADPLPQDQISVVGITVGKPVGGAVVRNTVRRRLAALLREALAGRRLRVLVVARPSAATAPFAQLRNELGRALV